MWSQFYIKLPGVFRMPFLKAKNNLSSKLACLSLFLKVLISLFDLITGTERLRGTSQVMSSRQ